MILPLLLGLAFGQTVDDERAVMEGVPVHRWDPVAVRDLRTPRHAEPQDPYAPWEYNAYTLEPGEVRVGLTRVTVGVLPRLQLSTFWPADGVGAANIGARLNALRWGPLDFSFFGQAFLGPSLALLEPLTSRLTALTELRDLRGLYAVGGAVTTSLRLLPAWSAHLTAHYVHAGARATASLDQLPDLLAGAAEDEAGDDTSSLEGDFVPRMSAQLFTLAFATDVRLNRRDSIVLQAQTSLFLRAGMRIGLDVEGLGPVDVGLYFIDDDPWAQTWMASLSWQFTWENADLRLGAGWSGTPGAFLFRAVDVGWRFGGPTRTRRNALRREWRRYAKQVGDGETWPLALAWIEELPPPPPSHPDLVCPPDTVLTGASPPYGTQAGCALLLDDRTPLPHGPTLTWHDADQLAVRGAWDYGRRHGTWTWWRSDGTLDREETWSHGERTGPTRSWWEDGTLAAEGELIEGERHGVWTFYDRLGHRAEQGPFDHGRREGLWTTWDADGEVIRLTTWRAGRAQQIEERGR